MASYRVNYEYLEPGPAGPFKGKAVLEYRGSTDRPAKGDVIYAVMGRALVKSVRKVKEVA